MDNVSLVRHVYDIIICPFLAFSWFDSYFVYLCNCSGGGGGAEQQHFCIYITLY